MYRTCLVQKLVAASAIFLPAALAAWSFDGLECSSSCSGVVKLFVQLFEFSNLIPLYFSAWQTSVRFQKWSDFFRFSDFSTFFRFSELSSFSDLFQRSLVLLWLRLVVCRTWFYLLHNVVV